jgi:AcrR family transcriptional regulator
LEKESRGVQTKYNIVNAAFGLLSEGNFQSMGTAKVAREAGISEGNIYRHFSGKKELFLATLRKASEELRALLTRGTGRNHTLRENMEILAKNFFPGDPEVRKRYCIVYKAFSEVEDPSVREALGEVWKQGLDAVRKIIQWSIEKREISPDSDRMELVPTLLWGFGDMMWKKSVMGLDIPPESPMVQDSIDLVCDLLGERR